MHLDVTDSDLTYHGWMRIHSRRIPIEGIDAALNWGREWYGAHCICFRVDRGVIAHAKRRGADLSAFDGITVKCELDNGKVMTAFRNRKGEKVWR